jgi:signal transduction histidine kinase
MNDLGRALEGNVEAIIERWIAAVHQDAKIVSAKELAYEAVRNSLPEVLEELAALLSRSLAGDEEELKDKSLCHGFVRAQQGYDTAEIVREYRLLRQVIMAVLEPDLLSGTPREIIHSLRLIDNVFDEVITSSLESYIESRLVELRQMQSQLTLTNQELVRLVQTQKDNLSYMAHELKTPLNSIIGYSNVLLRRQRQQLQESDSTTSLDQLERVLRNGRKLLQIINDTLEITRYDRGQMTLSPASIQVGALIRETVEDGLEPLATEKSLDLVIDIEQAPALVMTDELRLQQLVTNLVSNAIRYTEAGRVSIVCRQRDANFWEIEVADTGIGIEADARTTLFDPYVRASSQTQSVAGLGLGLAIVKRVVDLMAGQIELVSEVGKGSTFTVILPLILPES